MGIENERSSLASLDHGQTKANVIQQLNEPKQAEEKLSEASGNSPVLGAVPYSTDPVEAATIETFQGALERSRTSLSDSIVKEVDTWIITHQQTVEGQPEKAAPELLNYVKAKVSDEISALSKQFESIREKLEQDILRTVRDVGEHGMAARISFQEWPSIEEHVRSSLWSSSHHEMVAYDLNELRRRITHVTPSELLDFGQTTAVFRDALSSSSTHFQSAFDICKVLAATNNASTAQFPSMEKMDFEDDVESEGLDFDQYGVTRETDYNQKKEEVDLSTEELAQKYIEDVDFDGLVDSEFTSGSRFTACKAFANEIIAAINQCQETIQNEARVRTNEMANYLVNMCVHLNPEAEDLYISRVNANVKDLQIFIKNQFVQLQKNIRDLRGIPYDQNSDAFAERLNQLLAQSHQSYASFRDVLSAGDLSKSMLSRDPSQSATTAYQSSYVPSQSAATRSALSSPSSQLPPGYSSSRISDVTIPGPAVPSIQLSSAYSSALTPSTNQTSYQSSAPSAESSYQSQNPSSYQSQNANSYQSQNPSSYQSEKSAQLQSNQSSRVESDDSRLESNLSSQQQSSVPSRRSGPSEVPESAISYHPVVSSRISSIPTAQSTTSIYQSSAGFSTVSRTDDLSDKSSVPVSSVASSSRKVGSLSASTVAPSENASVAPVSQRISLPSEETIEEYTTVSERSSGAVDDRTSSTYSAAVDRASEQPSSSMRSSITIQQRSSLPSQQSTPSRASLPQPDPSTKFPGDSAPQRSSFPSQQTSRSQPSQIQFDPSNKFSGGSAPLRSSLRSGPSSGARSNQPRVSISETEETYSERVSSDHRSDATESFASYADEVNQTNYTNPAAVIPRVDEVNQTKYTNPNVEPMSDRRSSGTEAADSTESTPRVDEVSQTTFARSSTTAGARSGTLPAIPETRSLEEAQSSRSQKTNATRSSGTLVSDRNASSVKSEQRESRHSRYSGDTGSAPASRVSLAKVSSASLEETKSGRTNRSGKTNPEPSGTSSQKTNSRLSGEQSGTSRGKLSNRSESPELPERSRGSLPSARSEQIDRYPSRTEEPSRGSLKSGRITQPLSSGVSSGKRSSGDMQSRHSPEQSRTSVRSPEQTASRRSAPVERSQESIRSEQSQRSSGASERSETQSEPAERPSSRRYVNEVSSRPSARSRRSPSPPSSVSPRSRSSPTGSETGSVAESEESGSESRSPSPPPSRSGIAQQSNRRSLESQTSRRSVDVQPPSDESLPSQRSRAKESGSESSAPSSRGPQSGRSGLLHPKSNMSVRPGASNRARSGTSRLQMVASDISVASDASGASSISVRSAISQEEHSYTSEPYSDRSDVSDEESDPDIPERERRKKKQLPKAQSSFWK